METISSKHFKVIFLFLGLQGAAILLINLYLSNSAEGAVSFADRLILGYEPFKNGVFLLPIPLLFYMWLNRYINLKDRIVRFKSRTQITKDRIRIGGILSFVFTIEYAAVTGLISIFDQSLINWQNTNSFFFSLNQFVFQGQFMSVLFYTVVSFFLILLIALLLFDLVYLIFDNYFFSWIVILYLVIWDMFVPSNQSLLFRRFYINYSFYIGDEKVGLTLVGAVVLIAIILLCRKVAGDKKDFI